MPALFVWVAAVALALLEDDTVLLPVFAGELDDLALVDVTMLPELDDEPPGTAALPVDVVDEPLDVKDPVTEDVTVADG